MSSTDFSISEPTFVQFEYNGWLDEDKILLERSVRSLAGVTEVNRAGASSSIHVHYNPAKIVRDELILLVNQIANPILERIKISKSEFGRLSNDLILDDGYIANTGSVRPNETKVQKIEAIELATEPLKIDSSVIKVHDMVSTVTVSVPDISTRGTIRSSTWTGRKPLSEQINTIRTYAPLALAGLDALAAAIEDKRYNDEASQDALRKLKELRAAIDDLIQAAQRGGPLSNLWDLVEHRTNDLIEVTKTATKVIAGAPIIGLGAAYAISLLTGESVTGQMVATMAGGSLMAGAMSNAGKKA